jgi:hypothetical protein
VSREARRHLVDGDVEVVAQMGLSRNDSWRSCCLPRLP